MISLIVGNKGLGKTKRLISMVNEAAATSKGNVVCVEKGLKLTYDLTHAARLVDVEEYGIEGFDALYGFLTGMFAGNYDLTDLFVDATLKIGGRNYDELSKFLEKLSKICNNSDVNVVFTISCDESDLPESIFEFATII